MKIGFIYERFDAAAGSFGAHGYFLATELIRRGHELWGPGLPRMPGIVSLPPDKFGKLRMLRHVDLLYIRIANLGWLERCTWLRVLRPACPVVWEVNGTSEELLGGETPGREAVRLHRRDVRRKRRMARLVDAAVCVSDSLADYVRRCYGVQRCVVAPNGGDLSTYLPEGGNTFLSDMKGRFIVLWAGDAGLPWQGIDLIFDAARRCGRTATDVLFVLVLGGRKVHHPFPHLRNTVLLHRTDRLTAQRYLADADCVAVVYSPCPWRRADGSPLKLFEAMAARKPIIATPIGQIAEVIRDGVDGLLIPPDGESLTRAVLRLRDDRDCGRAWRRTRANESRRHTRGGTRWTESSRCCLSWSTGAEAVRSHPSWKAFHNDRRHSQTMLHSVDRLLLPDRPL